MPVLFAASAQANEFILNSATGSLSWNQNVSTAYPNAVAFVGVLWTGTVNASGATFTVSFGGVAMTQVAQVSWATSGGVLTVFQLINPPTGSKTVTASFSGMPLGGIPLQNFMACSVVEYNVATVGTPVVQAAPGTGTVNNSVTVAFTPGWPADRVLSFHGTGPGLTNYFTGQNQSPRANPGLPNGGELLAQDASGAASVTLTATHAVSTNWWGAIGIPLLPANVVGTAQIPVIGFQNPTARGGIKRVSTPPPSRTWIINGPTVPDGIPPALATAMGIPPNIWAPGPFYTQDPSAVLDYGLDFTQWLSPGDTLESVEFQPNSGDVNVLSQDCTGTLAVVWLDSIVNGSVTPVTCHITTTGGRQDDRTFTVGGLSQ